MDEQCKLYNKYLLKLTIQDLTYNNFCEAVAHTGQETAVSIKCKCEGWYAASEAILAPAIDKKNRLCHSLQEKNHLTPMEIDYLQQKQKISTSATAIL